MSSFEVLYPAAAVVDGKVISFTSGVVELPDAAAKPLVDSGHLKAKSAPKAKAPERGEQ